MLDYFSGKHVFFISDHDKFFYLFADALINRAGVSPDNICAVVYRQNQNCAYDTLQKLPNITYYKYLPRSAKCYENTKTITFMSLHKWNSGIVRELIDYSELYINKIHIFLTDDEVDRWYITYLKNNKLVINDKKGISENNIYVLSKLKLFIAHKGTFEEKLKLILDRQDINCIDASVIFDILPYQQSEKLQRITYAMSELSKSEKKILIGSKPRAFSIKDICQVIKSCCVENLHKEFSFLLLWPEKNGSRRIIVDLYLLYLKYVQGKKVNVAYVGNLSPLAYNVLIMSCSHFILQPRGGASTARLFLKWAQGSVCLGKGSPNYTYFKEAMGADTISFNDYNQLAKKIKHTVLNVKNNAISTLKEEERSSLVLLGIYS